MNKLILVALLLSFTNCIYASQFFSKGETVGWQPRRANIPDLRAYEEPLGSIAPEKMPVGTASCTSRQMISLSKCPLVPYMLRQIISLAFEPTDNTPIFLCKFFRDYIYELRSCKEATYTVLFTICEKWGKDCLQNNSPLPIPSYVQNVNLTGKNFTDTDAHCFESLTSVVRLNLSENGIGDLTALVLSQLPNLKHLDITNTFITQSGLARLRKSKPELIIEENISSYLISFAPQKKRAPSKHFHADSAVQPAKKAKRILITSH